MFTRFKVRGFKSAHEVEFAPGVVNVFVGSNGSGKTNLLEAIGLLAAAATGRVNDAALDSRGVRKSVPRLFKTSLSEQRLLPAIYLEAEWRSTRTLIYKAGLNNPLDEPRPAWDFKTESLVPKGRSQRPFVSRQPKARARIPVLKGVEMVAQVPREHGLAAFARDTGALPDDAADLVDALRGYAVYSPSTPTLRGMETDPTSNAPIGLAGGRLPEAVHEVMNSKQFQSKLGDQFFDLLGWVRSVRTGPPSRAVLAPNVPATRRVLLFSDRHMRADRDELSAYDASEGALYVLFMMVMALHEESPPMFAVDNFDQAMNPRLARRLTELLCDALLAQERPRQVFLTTHNPLTLDGLNLQDDLVRLFAVDRGRDGSTKVRRVVVDADLLAEAKQHGYSLSRLWVEGRLGGMPNL